jgi:hypothetical protein
MGESVAHACADQTIEHGAGRDQAGCPTSRCAGQRGHDRCDRVDLPASTASRNLTGKEATEPGQSP